MTTGTSEENLQWLLTLIQGKRYPYSKGLCSYDTPTPDHQGLHQACLEVERRSLILRLRVEGERFEWLPKET